MIGMLLDSHRIRTSVLLCGAGLAAWAGAGWAKPSCRVDPGRSKVYRLELTVPATYCRQAGDERDCRDFPKQTAIHLHGLWPNYQSGFPSGYCPQSECRVQSDFGGRYCGYPALPEVYQTAWWAELKPYMAGTGKCLERHEWVKHGTCSPMDPGTYFHWALDTTQRIATALQPVADQPLTRARFDALVRDALPELAGSLRLKCKGRSVSSLYVLYEWGDRPSRPIPTRERGNHFGNCRDSFTLPTRP
jgi:ribonuclease T2